MMARTFLLLVVTMLIALLPSFVARAGEGMTYIHNGPESADDHRYDYHWEILRTALERTQDTHGPFRLQTAEFMTEARQTKELEAATGTLTIMFLGTTPQLEERLLPVRIPVDKNLSGYFVLLIRADDQERFRTVRTLDDLKRFSMGLGSDWLDNAVYRHNALKVVTGSNYDGLFEMLLHRRFDAFPRSGVEVLGEYEARKRSLPGLHIEEKLMLSYPWPMYFWFAKTEQGKALAERAQEGMMAMVADGAYDRIFRKYFAKEIERLDLRHRRLIELVNPQLPPQTPVNDKRLWFDPYADY